MLINGVIIFLWIVLILFSETMHCFEIRTGAIDFFVGEDPLYGRRDVETREMAPPETGIGAHLAKSWETSIRQALMPVLTHASECPTFTL